MSLSFTMRTPQRCRVWRGNPRHDPHGHLPLGRRGHGLCRRRRKRVAQREAQPAGRLRRGDHRLRDGRLRRPRRRPRQAIRLLPVLEPRARRCLRQLQQLRTRRRPDRARQVRAVDLLPQALRVDERHLHGHAARLRRGGDVSLEVPECQAGAGPHGPPGRRTPRLAHRDRSRCDSREGALDRRVPHGRPTLPSPRTATRPACLPAASFRSP